MLMAQRDVIHDSLSAINFFKVDKTTRTDFREMMILSVVVWNELKEKILDIAS